VGESEAGGETTEPKYAMIEILPEKMEVEPWVYNDTLEDVESDLEADLTEEAGIGFAEGEAAAFISGTGVKQPRGILSYTIVANASYAWGKVGYIASGGAGAWAASNPADKIIDLQHALKQQYRNGAVFLMADSTLASVRQLKDGSGNYYLWQPDPSANFSGRILGSPVEIDDNMPAIAANSYSIAFANFRRAYTVVDRRGTSLIRDNITTKGTTKFNFTRRVGGGISHFEAIKLMKFATS
jgi:HK97 family phage major capsid protein